MFCKEIENQLQIHNIEGTLLKPSIMHQEIENIDQLITRILNQARNRIEDIERNILSSKEKVRHLGELLFRKKRLDCPKEHE